VVVVVVVDRLRVLVQVVAAVRAAAVVFNMARLVLVTHQAQAQRKAVTVHKH
jgi:hypothetical protein